MRSIAFVDFDHNIYNGDSMLDFLKLVMGERGLRIALLKSSHAIIAYKSKLISGHKAKEVLFKHSLRHQSPSSLKPYVDQFTESIDQKLYPKAVKELEKHKNNQVDVVIVSASSPLWLEPWCKNNNFGLLATELELKNGLFTGSLAGNNCKGLEKARRIKSVYKLEEYDQVFCYGDDKSDIPMLQLANQPIVNLFD